MKKFIKKNWLKISIAVLLIIICVYLVAYFLPKSRQKASLDLQEKCLEVGRKAYEVDLQQDVTNGFFNEPRYGYSKKLKTCIYSSGFHYLGDSSKGVGGEGLKHNCNAYWERWVKNSYTNEKIIQVSNFSDSNCEWTTKTENIEKFDTESDELFIN